MANVKGRIKISPVFVLGVSIIVFLFFPRTLQCQVFYQLFRPEDELIQNFNQAHDVQQKIDAGGTLAQFYKSKFRDSLALKYVAIISSLAETGEDLNLKARALWWESRISAGITAYEETKLAIKKLDALINFSRKHSLVPWMIAAHIVYADIEIRKNLDVSEQHALQALSLLESWNAASLIKDSMRLEVYYRLTHIAIHKKEGLKTSDLLQKQHKYILHSPDETIRMQATSNLGQLYLEWRGQEVTSIKWMKKLHAYFKARNEACQFITAYQLSDLYLRIGDTTTATAYFSEAERVQRDRNIYSVYSYWITLEKRSLGLLSDKSFLELLNNNFNGNLALPSALIDLHKGSIYMTKHRLDSAGYYFRQAQRHNMDSLGLYFSHYDYLPAEYFLLRKDFKKAILSFADLQTKAEETGDRNKYLVALDGLSKAYSGLGKYKIANALRDRYHEIKDSLDRQNFNADIAFLEAANQTNLLLSELENKYLRQQDSLKYQNALQKIEQENERKLHAHNLQRYGLYSIVIILVVLSFSLYGLHRYRIRQFKLKSELEKEQLNISMLEVEYQNKLNETNLAAIRSQMNPHFIFNTLNTVQGFVYTGDKANAADYLGKFSQLIRNVLYNSEKQQIYLAEEIEMLQLYTEIERTRIGPSLTVTISVDENLETKEILIPPMFIQPYVENAIKHGLFHKTGDKALSITIGRSDESNMIKVIVEDDGIGRKVSAKLNENRVDHNSFATAANEMRITFIKKTLNKNANISIIDKQSPGGSSAGTRVILNIPSIAY